MTLNKVLIVDDSALIHQMYHLVLRTRYRCEILDAQNGQEALDLLARHDDIQLVLLDINMPVMNGVRFLEQAGPLGYTKRIPMIIISTEGKEGDTIQGLRLGASGYLTKPFTPSQLHEVVSKVLQGAAPPLECRRGEFP